MEESQAKGSPILLRAEHRALLMFGLTERHLFVFLERIANGDFHHLLYVIWVKSIL